MHLRLFPLALPELPLTASYNLAHCRSIGGQKRARDRRMNRISTRELCYVAPGLRSIFPPCRVSADKCIVLGIYKGRRNAAAIARDFSYVAEMAVPPGVLTVFDDHGFSVIAGEAFERARIAIQLFGLNTCEHHLRATRWARRTFVA
jgi:hypothetical protein